MPAPDAGQPAPRIERLCERARECGEGYVFVAGRWVLGASEDERRASLALLASHGLCLILGDEYVTVLPNGKELRHHRPRPWDE